MVRSLLLLLGMLTADRPVRRDAGRYRADSYGRNEPGTLLTDPDSPGDRGIRGGYTEPLSPWRPRETGPAGPEGPGRPGGRYGHGRRRIPLRQK